MQRAWARIVQAQWAEAPDEKVEAVLLEAIVKTFRTGFAGTVCRTDPLRCEFVWDIPERIGSLFADIMTRAIADAAIQTVGQPVARVLEHPLLGLARELYPAQTDPESVLGVGTTTHVARFGVKL